MSSTNWPIINDKPAVRVSGSAKDVVPTVQYGNITIGPVVVERFVPDGTDEEIQEHAARAQRIAENVVGSERRTVQWGMSGNPQAKFGGTAG